MSTMIPDAEGLVDYILDFTGSNNRDEIKQCIFLTDMMLRNIELPALRTDPYNTIGTADENGYIPIPADMNRPILFFNQGTAGNGGTLGGPWIVYDRIGDRDMITQQLIENLYLNPVNIPQVYRGKFSEVGQVYQFIPGLGAGAVINLYYFTTFPELFAAQSDNLISTTAEITNIVGSVSPWTITIDMTSVVGLNVGDEIICVADPGSFGTGTTLVTDITGNTVTAVITGGTGPILGDIVDVTVPAGYVSNNVVLQSFPEGYVYGTLHNYYYKRKMSEDADKWLAKFNLAYDTVEDQNNKGKWSGGHTRMTSIWQPRQNRRMTAK